MKKMYYILIFMLLCSFVFGKPVSEQDASTVASNWCKQWNMSNHSVGSVDALKDESTELVLYFANLNPSGFVLVAGDDEVRPIIGYSFENGINKDRLPMYIDDLVRRWFLKTSAIINDNNYISHFNDDWAHLANSLADFVPRRDTRSVLIPIYTHWHQWEPFNNLMPGDASPGCATIALAQILKYWQYPLVGTGIHTNNCDAGSFTVNFLTETGYDWSLMPPYLYENNPTEMINEVSKLVHNVGVAINANWGDDSGANYSDVVSALEDHFRYSTTAQHIMRLLYWDWPSWFDDLINEIDNGRPVLYGGTSGSTGHAYVLHGYQMVGDYPAFYLNTGGLGPDGYYFLDSGASYDPPGHNMNYYNLPHAVIGIQPINSVSQSMLQIESQNLVDPLNIGGTTADLMGNTSAGTTPYKRFFSGGSSVSLTAPLNAENKRFIKWVESDVIDYSSNRNISINLTSSPGTYRRYFKAIYGQPTISTIPVTLNFGSIIVNTMSPPQSYQLLGTNLVDNITIQSAVGYLISTSQNGNYVNTLSIQHTSGTVNQTIWVRFQPEFAQQYNHFIAHATTGTSNVNIPVSGTGINPNSPILQTSPTSLSFGAITQNTVSSPQNYLLTGNYLTANVTITAPTGYRVATSQNGTYSTSLTINQSGGNVSTAIWVRFQPSQEAEYTGFVTNTTASASAQVSVWGEGIVGASPELIVNPTALNFGNVSVNSNSTPQSYTLSGNNLISNVTVTAPNCFQVSNNQQGPFNNYLVINHSMGELSATIWIRFQPEATQSYSGYLVNTSGSAIVSLWLSGSGENTSTNTFTDINAELLGIIHQSVCWGDYDNDGDLDFLMSGFNATIGLVTKIYRNDENGAFSDINAGIIGVSFGSAAWGDYDNDGDLDFVLTGKNSNSTCISIVYKNIGNDSFSPLPLTLPGIYNSAVAWADYDNDGDLDLVLSGASVVSTSEVFPITKIYRNEGNDIFVEHIVGLIGLRDSALDWGDYDNDGDLDLLMAGGDGQNYARANVYRNDGSTFVLASSLGGVWRGSVAWGDYDNDGYIDVLLSGQLTPNPVAKVFRNNGNGTFTDVNADLLPVAYASSRWGDFDNDGDLDIAHSGSTGSLPFCAKIYRNDGNNEFIDMNVPIIAIAGSLVWGDMNNDSRLDILASGMINYPTGITHIYQNNISIQNSAPQPPSNLRTTLSGNYVTFQWDPSTDAETTSNGLSYCLIIGTSPNGSDICSPMASSLGYRRIPIRGYANSSCLWKIKASALPEHYYWGVQAVDTAFAGSSFAMTSPPVLNLPNSLTFEEDGSLVLDVSQFVLNPTNEFLTVNVSNNQNVLCSINGSIITISSSDDWFGTEQIQISVDNHTGQPSVSQAIAITVTPEYDPPAINLPDTFTLVEDGTLLIDMNQYAYHADGLPMTITHSNGDNIIITVEGMLVTLSAMPNWYGSETISFTVDDGISRKQISNRRTSSSDNVEIIVFPVNDAPLLNLPESITFNEDESLEVDVASYTVDIDSDQLTLSALGNQNVTVSIVGMVASVGALPNWNGTEVLTFTVNDNMGRAIASNLVSVIVTPVYDPPVINLPDSFTLEEDGTLWAVMDQFVYHPDNLPITLTSSGGQNVFISIEGMLVTFTAVENWSGTEQVTFFVDDAVTRTESLSTRRSIVSDVVDVIVAPVNDPPVINLPDSFTFNEDESLEVDIGLYTIDVDGDQLTLSVTGNQNVTVSFAGMLATIGALPDWNGTEELTFTVNDNMGRAITLDMVNIIVTPVYDYPIINLPDTFTFAEDGSLLIDMNQYASHADGLPMTITHSDSDNIVINIDGMLVTLSATPNWHGSETITFTVDDGNNRRQISNKRTSAFDSVEIIVTPVNDAPVITEFSPDQTTLSVALNDVVTFEIEFFDVEGDVSLSWHINDIEQTSTANEFAYQFNESGYYFVKAIVSDGFYSDEQVWSVTTPVDIDDGVNPPLDTRLKQNYPNPFNPTTIIEYSVRNPSHASVVVYNSRGALVKTLVSDMKTPGFYQITWNGEDNTGKEVSSGVYFIVLKADSVVSCKKMLLMK